MKVEKREIRIVGFGNTGAAGEEIGATYCQANSKGKQITGNGPTVGGNTKYFRVLIKLVKKD